MFNISFNSNPKLDVAAREKTEHLLTLKVMRLMRPSLVNSIIVTTDENDLPGNLLNNHLKNEITTVPGSETISSGQFLLLPQCFGSIYLGETFSSYICVHNDSGQVAKDVTVKAVLQTQSFEIMLSKDPNQSTDLEPGNTINEVLHHEVKEFGPHVLICEVSYCAKSLSSDVTSFRKFFKFEVLKPLEVKTKLYTAESDDVYLEAQIQNLISGAVTLEHVSLEASPAFQMTELAPKGDRCDIMRPNASRQLLYKLTPVDRKGSLTTVIGKLDLAWRTNMGERGRLQTSPLYRNTPAPSDLEVVVVKSPDIVKPGEEFTVTCRLTNTTDEEMNISVEIEPSPGVEFKSASRLLSPLAARMAILAVLRLSATASAGTLTTISGVTFIDTIKEKRYQWDELIQVYVLPP